MMQFFPADIAVFRRATRMRSVKRSSIFGFNSNRIDIANITATAKPHLSTGANLQIEHYRYSHQQNAAHIRRMMMRGP